MLIIEKNCKNLDNELDGFYRGYLKYDGEWLTFNITLLYSGVKKVKRRRFGLFERGTIFVLYVYR